MDFSQPYFQIIYKQCLNLILSFHQLLLVFHLTCHSAPSLQNSYIIHYFLTYFMIIIESATQPKEPNTCALPPVTLLCLWCPLVFIVNCWNGLILPSPAWYDFFFWKGSSTFSIFLYQYCLIQMPACFSWAAANDLYTSGNPTGYMYYWHTCLHSSPIPPRNILLSWWA